MQIENRVAIITGATGGLGSVVTRQFTDANTHLALFGRTQEKLESLASQCGLNEKDTILKVVDLIDGETTAAAVADVQAHFGRLDILIHLVGGWIGGKPIAEVDDDDVEDMLQQHVWTTLHMTRACLPYMQSNSWGRLIAISSPVAFNPTKNTYPYVIAKAGQQALMLSLAQELRGTGITSNVIQVRTIDVAHERDNHPTKKNAFWTTPEEIGAMILHLCSNEAGMINGALIPMYGAT